MTDQHDLEDNKAKTVKLNTVHFLAPTDLLEEPQELSSQLGLGQLDVLLQRRPYSDTRDFNEPFSHGSRLIVEYERLDHSLQPEVRRGLALPGQKVAMVGLRVLAHAVLHDGTIIRRGSTAYVAWETLHGAPWVKPRELPLYPGKQVLVLEMAHVDLIDPAKE